MARIGTVPTSSFTIPELTSDPIDPQAGDAWVLQSGSAGTPIGLLLALTKPTATYLFSYRTLAGTTIRRELT